MEKSFRWLLGALIVGTVVFALVVVNLVRGPKSSNDGVSSEKNSSEGRRWFANYMNEKTGAKPLATEGDGDRGLILDLRDCSVESLNTYLSNSEVLRRLDEFGFSYIRCADSNLKVTKPWR